MKKFFFSLVCFIFLAVGGIYFYVQNERKQFNNTNFAAKINQEIISLEEFEERLNLMIKITNVPYKNKNFNKKAFRSLVIEKLIEEKFILEEVQEISLEIETELSNRYNAIALKSFPNYDPTYSLQAQNISIDFWEKRRKEVALKNHFLQSLKKTIPVTQEEITGYYTNNAKDFMLPEKYEIQHIQVESLEVAEYLKEEILRGVNFDRLVDQYSVGEQTFLGEEKSFIVQKGQLPKEFEKAILILKEKKEKIALIKSNYGVHLFQLKKVIPEKKLILAEARLEIIDVIKKKKLPVAFKDWLKIKKKNSQIFINQQFIENASKI